VRAARDLVGADAGAVGARALEGKALVAAVRDVVTRGICGRHERDAHRALVGLRRIEEDADELEVALARRGARVPHVGLLHAHAGARRGEREEQGEARALHEAGHGFASGSEVPLSTRAQIAPSVATAPSGKHRHPSGRKKQLCAPP
jgi:hypothetical protein